MKRGFSLVELSIVLVILGLLTGGILAGQSLIRAAELRSFNTEITRYITAMGSFRDKYFALPGDMPNATKFWPAAHGTPANCKTTSNASATCDGDGNGMVQQSAPGSYEPFRFWQHLALAGLIEGSYIGVGANSITDYSQPGTNGPRGRLEGVGYFAVHEGSAYVGDTYRFDGEYKNHFRIGKDDGSGWNNNAFIKPEELWNVDTKMDDGRPALGNLRSWKTAYLPNCVTNDTSAADYALTQPGKNCAAIAFTGY